MEIRDVHAMLGRTAYAADGDRLGTVSGAYLDNATGRPSWITVDRGGLLRGTTRTFVPIDGAEPAGDGVRLPVDGDDVRRAPHVDDDRVLTRADEERLRSHYGVSQPAESAEPIAEATAGPAAEPAQAAEAGTMTRSEERPRVATATVPASRAVLRRTRVVEDRSFSVPLGRDQVQVVYEPLPDRGPEPVSAAASQGEPRDDLRDGDDDGWMVLYEERLVVRTEWVPVERVRLGTAAVQSTAVVPVDLRRERIDVDVERAPDAPATAAAPSSEPAD